ncbi:MAG TPA: hypothetical protein VMY34_06625 [Acidimicrobiales bacterium]|nr:hypothetical protein [Acidimicrobiales bacterium]
MTLAGLGIAAAQTADAPSEPPAVDVSPSGGVAFAGDRGMKRGPGHDGPFADLTIAAKAIGITEEQLRTDMHAGKSIAQVAEAKGVEVDAVVKALVDDAKAHMAEHVVAGRMTQADADKRAENLEARVTEMVNAEGGAKHRGPGGPGGPGFGMKANLSVAAKALGISEADLRTALMSGQSLAQVAESKGVKVETVVKALVEEFKSHLAAKVAAGELTQAQADDRAAGLEAHITAIVSHAGFGGKGRRDGGHDARPPLDEEAPSAAV